jgi:type II secretory pathway pseudopilin PulG
MNLSRYFKRRDRQNPNTDAEVESSTPGTAGVTLVEVMVATVVLLLVVAAILTIVSQSQQTYTSQYDLIEAAQIGRIAMNQIQSFLRQAGNDPEEVGFTPISVASNAITILSDVTGAVGDDTGGPDGDVDDLYEKVVIAYNPGTDQLTVDVNDGSGPQVLAENVVDFALETFDLNGASTSDGTKIARVAIHMVIRTDQVSQQTGKPNTLTLDSNVMIRSQASQLFGYEADQDHVSTP